VGKQAPEDITVKLTNDIAAALELPAGKKELFIWDDAAPGLGVRLRTTKRGDVIRRWIVQYRFGREQRRENLGDPAKVSITTARKVAKQRHAKVELGTDPRAERAEAKSGKLKVGTLVDSYLKARRSDLAPSTFVATTRYLKVSWRPLHATAVDDVKRATVAARLNELAADHGKIAASRARSNLQSMFKWAMMEGLAESNPAIATRDPGDGAMARERVLDSGEIKSIWSACLDDDFGRIVKLLLLTGCRREEIGGLRWSEINLETGIMTVSASRTKTKRALILPLPPMALDILRSMPPAGEFVFGARGFRAWSYSVLALRARLAEASGQTMPDWRLHDLRRTMRTGLGALKVAPHIAELVIGHAKKGIVAVYDKYAYGPEIKTALLRWAEHVASIVEERPSNVVPMVHS